MTQVCVNCRNPIYKCNCEQEEPEEVDNVIELTAEEMSKWLQYIDEVKSNDDSEMNRLIIKVIDQVHENEVYAITKVKEYDAGT